MSYIQLLSGIPDFRRATISLWFRAPKKSLEAVADKAEVERQKAIAWPDPYYPYPAMHQILPILTFGPKFDGYHIKLADPEYTEYTESYGRWNGAYFPATDIPPTVHVTPAGLNYERTSIYHANPSFIGVKATWKRDNNGNPTDELETELIVRMQTREFGSGVGLRYDDSISISDYTNLIFAALTPGAATETAFDNTADACVTRPIWPDSGKLTHISYTDASDFETRRYGADAIQGRVVVRDERLSANKTISPDRWHHVLASVALSVEPMVGRGSNFIYTYPDCPGASVINGVRQRDTVSQEDVSRVTYPCKMYIALDDVHYSDVAFPGTPVPGRGLGRNDVPTEYVWAAATRINASTLREKSWGIGTVNTLTFDAKDLPTYSTTGGPFAGTARPFGIPATASLAGSIRNIELAEFQMWTGKTIDTNNKFARRLFVDEYGKPVKPKIAAKALGTPLILLNGSGNWIKGKNTATRKSRSLKPKGVILRYKPDPSLHGPQEDEPRPYK